MLDFMNVVRALGDENRVRILMALYGQSMCVCQITGFLDLSPSTTSKHLSILRQARLIESKKRGKWVYYRLAEGPRVSALVRDALQLLRDGMENEPVILEDMERIRAITAMEHSFLGADEDEAALEKYHSLEIHTLSESESEDE